MGEWSIIYIRLNDISKRCEIWVDYSEKPTYKMAEEYIQVIDKFKKLKYAISVFIGGDRPLLPTLEELLEAQECQIQIETLKTGS